MRQLQALTPLVVCVVLLLVVLAAPAVIVVRRTVIPWKFRWRHKDDPEYVRLDPDREIEIKVGPVRITDRPAHLVDRTSSVAAVPPVADAASVVSEVEAIVKPPTV